MNLSKEFKRRGKKMEEFLPADIKTSSIALAFSICAFPLSTEVAVGILAGPTVFQGLAGGLQSVGNLLERNEP